MRVRIKAIGSKVEKVHDVPCPMPIHLNDGTTELRIHTPEGIAVITLSGNERDELSARMRRVGR